MKKCYQIILFGLFLFHINLSAQAADFLGTVKINGCSGSLVRFNFSHGTDQALVLSAGHCAAANLKPHIYVYYMDVFHPVKFLNSNGRIISHSSHAIELLYATMERTDIALYALDETFSEIEMQTGVKALTISNTDPRAGEEITIISSQLEKIYSCSIEKIVYQLIEGDYTWLGSLRYSQTGCEVSGGTSGSPILNSLGQLIGLNNTGNTGGRACADGSPCEKNEAGLIYSKAGLNYGQKVNLISTCFNRHHEFDLTTPDCELFF